MAMSCAEVKRGIDMKTYIERAAVHNLVKSLPKYHMFSYDRTEGMIGISPDDVDFGVDKIPTADVAEVRHGRWIEDERTYPGPGLKNNLCSVCGEIAGSWKEGLEPGRKWAYCPNCGARMGKEDEHG